MISIIDEEVANAAARTWWWIYKVPEVERDKVYLNTVSSVVRRQFRLFGENRWKAYLRVSIFLVRYVNRISYTTAYCLNKIYRVFVRAM